MDELLPLPINLLSLLIIEFQTRLLDQTIGFGILEAYEIRPFVQRSAGMEDLVGI